jgi:hypothetical protein
VTLSGPDLRRVAWQSEMGEEHVSDPTTMPSPQTAASTPYPAGTRMAIESPDAAPPATHIALEEGQQPGEDLEDVLLLFDSTHATSFDANLCRLAEYYGLVCSKLDLRTTPLADELLRDGNGEYFKLVGIDAGVLLGIPSLLSDDELGAVRRAIETSGVSLLVSDMRDEFDPTLLGELTDGAVLGATELPRSVSGWLVSSTVPEITLELTGQSISSRAARLDFGLTLGGGQGEVDTLIASRDSAGKAYPVFVKRNAGEGSILVSGSQRGESLEELPLREMYYVEDNFSKIIPLMFGLRYALDDEAWHSEHDYANLTIDAVALTEPFGNLSFVELLGHMAAHDFHTTIALVPRTWDQTEPRVARLFNANPGRYSLVQRGNNADGYEFYRYAVGGQHDQERIGLSSRTIADQEDDILEGLERMERHEERSGIACDRVMVFPWGICPEPTLVLLKRDNFLATVNAQSIPLDAAHPAGWDHGMRPANMEYGNFAMLERRHPGTYQPFRPRLRSFVLDLFIDKPALFYSGAGQLFSTGTHSFNTVADEINGLEGDVEWRSLGYIVKHLYLEKRNDDGSVDVRMYTNHLVLTNDSLGQQTYHISKAETLNVPIRSLTVNGRAFPYRVEGNNLELDLSVAPVSPVEIVVRYGD